MSSECEIYQKITASESSRACVLIYRERLDTCESLVNVIFSALLYQYVQCPFLSFISSYDFNPPITTVYGYSAIFLRGKLIFTCYIFKVTLGSFLLILNKVNTFYFARKESFVRFPWVLPIKYGLLQ